MVRYGLWALLALLPLSLAAGAPKVAVVYSAWSGGTFKDEFDPHLKALGWTFEKFENREMPKLAPRLGEFDVVIATGVANYENPVDMAPYAADWLGFLRRGGVLWITDASYGTSLDLWVNRLGPEFRLTTTTCAAHRRDKPDPDRRTYATDDPLFVVPNDVPPLLAQKTNLWAHLDSWTPGWISLVTCADDRSLAVYRDVGQGCLLVTSYFSFRGAGETPLVSALLQNLWLHVQAGRAGLRLTSLKLGEAMPGEHELALGLQNSADTAATWQVQAELATGGQTAGLGERAVTLPPGASQRVLLPYRLAARGDVTFRLRLSGPQGHSVAIDRAQHVPELLTLEVGNRHFYPGDRQMPCRLTFAPAREDPLAECQAELTLDGQPAAPLPKLAPALDQRVELPAGLAAGDHTLALRLRHGERTLGQIEVPLAVHPAPRVGVRADGTILVEGKSLFPFGWYHVSWPFTAENRLEFLRSIAAGGFNTVHASLKQMDEWDPFLAEAEKLGVMVITEFGVDMKQAIERYRGRKAVLAWNPGDEPDGAGIPPATMLDRHNRMKAWDPDVPTFMTLCRPDLYSRYAHCAQVLAPDPYPLHRTGGSTATVYQSLSRASEEAAKAGTTVWGILQCFGYDDPKLGGWRVPTFAEARNMTWLAVLAGVHGVLYYTYRDTGFDMAKHPELWQGMCTLPGEVKRVEPWLLNGRRTPLTGLSPDLYATAWTLDGRTLVAVVNTATEARDVSVPLPAGVAGEAQALRLGAALTVREGKLVGRLEPLGIGVCELR